MTELSLNPGLPSSSVTLPEPTPGRWKRPIIAATLSLFFAGLGQLYNRQLRKAIVFALIGPAVDVLGGRMGAFHILSGLATMVIFSTGWKIFVLADAFLNARKQALSERPTALSRIVSIPVFLLTVCPFVLYGLLGDYFFNHIAHARGYKVPSTSMCPTICEGERLIADPSAYSAGLPQRGDLIVFQHRENTAMYIKRVIALPGDVVSQSEDGILVNGKPAALVELKNSCGNPPEIEKAYTPIESKSLEVPASSLYVVGDNWSNSNDSRIEGFGFASVGSVRGRPLFLYWSPYKNRIGCRLQ